MFGLLQKATKSMQEYSNVKKNIRKPIGTASKVLGLAGPPDSMRLLSLINHDAEPSPVLGLPEDQAWPRPDLCSGWPIWDALQPHQLRSRTSLGPTELAGAGPLKYLKQHKGLL